MDSYETPYFFMDLHKHSQRRVSTDSHINFLDSEKKILDTLYGEIKKKHHDNHYRIFLSF